MRVSVMPLRNPGLMIASLMLFAFILKFSVSLAAAFGIMRLHATPPGAFDYVSSLIWLLFAIALVLPGTRAGGTALARSGEVVLFLALILQTPAKLLGPAENTTGALLVDACFLLMSFHATLAYAWTARSLRLQGVTQAHD